MRLDTKGDVFPTFFAGATTVGWMKDESVDLVTRTPTAAIVADDRPLNRLLGVRDAHVANR